MWGGGRQAGTVNKVTLLGDGAALVEFDTAAAAEKAVAVTGTPLGANDLKLAVTLEAPAAPASAPSASAGALAEKADGGDGAAVGSKREAPDAAGGDGDAAAEAKTEDADGGDAKRSRVE